MKQLSLALVLGSLAIAGCSGGFSERREVGDTLRVGIESAPTTMDPGRVQDLVTIDLLGQTYETLLRYDSAGELQPLLVDDYEISPDGTTYVFNLKPDVRFHNGDTMTAEHVKWSWERSVAPELASPIGPTYFDAIRGVDEMADGSAEEISGITVLDENTLQVELKQPAPYFLGMLTYPSAAVLDPEVAPFGQEMIELEQLVGTGPYRVVGFEPGMYVSLEAFPDYHGGQPVITELEYVVLEDAVTRINKFRQNEVDITVAQLNDVATIESDPELADNLYSQPSPSITYLGLQDTAFEPFMDKRVRLAFSHAIDRERIVEDALRGLATPALGILPPAVPGHRGERLGPEYNPELARQLLAEAGYPNGEGFPDLTLFAGSEDPDIKLLMSSVTIQLRENLNIEVKETQLDWGAFLTKLNRREVGFFVGNWVADYLDPENFLSKLFAGYGSANRIRYQNEQADEYFLEADRLTEMDERLPLYQAGEDLILEDAVWVPLYYPTDYYLVSERVEDIERNVQGWYRFDDAQLN
ncbi:MAG: ABC transporter substrate-binding protein [Fimbriimonadaceae bacterium]